MITLEKQTPHRIAIGIIFMSTTISYLPMLNLEWLKYIMIAWSGLFVLLRIKNNEMRLSKKDIDIIFPLFCFLVFSTMFQDITLKQQFVAIFFYIILFFWSILGKYIFVDIKDIRAAGFGIFFGVAYGLFSSIPLIKLQLNNVYNSRNRIWGGFSHANTLGSICVVGILAFFIYLTFHGSKIRKYKKVINILIIVSLAIVLYMSKSRTSWIVSLVFVIVYQFRKFNKFSKPVQILLSLLVLILLGYIAFFFYQSYAINDTAFMSRIQTFHTMEATPKSFLFGEGMTSTSNLYETKTTDSAMEIAWIMLFYKTGILGVISWLVILLKLFLSTFKLRNEKQKWILLSSLCAFLIGTFGEAYLVNITNVFPMFMWILLGALSSNEFADLSSE